jgi:alanyl-tRNA synthetase
MVLFNMGWMSLSQLREKYLAFFESKAHLRLGSFSLIPNDDKSLLLINSGMAPMKKYFTGQISPPNKRVTTCQKCIRTPDIDRVGITARHGTYFEMLGNFSFGDYFKKEAIAWAWEFCTEVIKLPQEKLWISIYEDDTEAQEIWTQEIGLDKIRVIKLGKKDNFWEHGTGPCGPCSEIYYDRGKQYGCGLSSCTVGCDCDRFVEFWNLVFTQFESDGQGNYTPLIHPNIDTGMGLERLACIIQGVDNLFLVDTMQKIMDHICCLCGVVYGENEKLDISLRVITDHIRSTVFMIADGVLPSNEGRGYILRRLLRRAAMHVKLLLNSKSCENRANNSFLNSLQSDSSISHMGEYNPFLATICKTVVEENKEAYPELIEKLEFIQKLIAVEEANFAKTIDQGLQILSRLIEQKRDDFSTSSAQNENFVTSNQPMIAKNLSGEDAFLLHDTYGFPIDLTKEILAERGFKVDESGFKKLLLEQKERARKARKNAEAWQENQLDLSKIDATHFEGYKTLSLEAKVLAILKDGNFINHATNDEDEKILLILDKTPFYAQGGGQSGDSGEIASSTAILDVTDTQKNSEGVFLHSCIFKAGSIKVGDYVKAKVCEKLRNRVSRNHTAAHLLHAALRKVLGAHVTQAGQMVDDNLIRFDFTHFSALKCQEIREVEKLVNDQIFSCIDVENFELPIDEAKKIGAMALFSEKYGDIVRVVRAGDFSIELCGGTHVKNASTLGLFKILSENSVASGVRRIEAVTCEGALKLLNDSLQTIKECCSSFKIGNEKDLEKVCKQLVLDQKKKNFEIEKLSSKLASIEVEKLISNAREVNGVCVIVGSFVEMKVENLQNIGNEIKNRVPDALIVLSGINNEKANILVQIGPNLQKKGLHAGKFVNDIAKLADGKGGGKPSIAMAGVKNLSKLELALNAVDDILLKSI